MKLRPGDIALFYRDWQILSMSRNCLGALKVIGKMTSEQAQNLGFEITTLGMRGINVNDLKSE
jgi:hypothetical protein